MTAQITAFLTRNELYAEYVTELCTEQEYGHCSDCWTNAYCSGKILRNLINKFDKQKYPSFSRDNISFLVTATTYNN
jgi:hypothetical protein